MVKWRILWQAYQATGLDMGARSEIINPTWLGDTSNNRSVVDTGS
jgi:hypothetical protein